MVGITLEEEGSQQSLNDFIELEASECEDTDSQASTPDTFFQNEEFEDLQKTYTHTSYQKRVDDVVKRWEHLLEEQKDIALNPSSHNTSYPYEDSDIDEKGSISSEDIITENGDNSDMLSPDGVDTIPR